jgi:hypothetical protein
MARGQRTASRAARDEFKEEQHMHRTTRAVGIAISVGIALFFATMIPIKLGLPASQSVPRGATLASAVFSIAGAVAAGLIARGAAPVPHDRSPLVSLRAARFFPRLGHGAESPCTVMTAIEGLPLHGRLLDALGAFTERDGRYHPYDAFIVGEGRERFHATVARLDSKDDERNRWLFAVGDRDRIGAEHVTATCTHMRTTEPWVVAATATVKREQRNWCIVVDAVYALDGEFVARCVLDAWNELTDRFDLPDADAIATVELEPDAIGWRAQIDSDAPLRDGMKVIKELNALIKQALPVPVYASVRAPDLMEDSGPI